MRRVLPTALMVAILSASQQQPQPPPQPNKPRQGRDERKGSSPTPPAKPAATPVPSGQGGSLIDFLRILFKQKDREDEPGRVSGLEALFKKRCDPGSNLFPNSCSGTFATFTSGEAFTGELVSFWRYSAHGINGPPLVVIWHCDDTSGDLGVIVTFVVPYERPVSAWRWRGLRSCKEGRVEIPRRDIRNLSDVQILVELQPTDNPRDARVFLPAELSGSAAQPGTDYVAKFGGPVALQFETPNKAGGAVGTDTKAGVRTLKYRVAGHYTYVMFPED